MVIMSGDDFIKIVVVVAKFITWHYKFGRALYLIENIVLDWQTRVTTKIKKKNRK